MVFLGKEPCVLKSRREQCTFDLKVGKTYLLVFFLVHYKRAFLFPIVSSLSSQHLVRGSRDCFLIWNSIVQGLQRDALLGYKIQVPKTWSSNTSDKNPSCAENPSLALFKAQKWVLFVLLETDIGKNVLICLGGC